MLKIFQSKEAWGEKEYHALIETLLSPALLLRERVIDAAAFNRFVSALSHLEHTINKSRAKLLKEFEKLFDTKLSKLKIDPL